ncbi:helix-turn-helix transcriptional regulator [Oceanicoccus sp. KOV_DT_Chl]|uniref:helix-turn-helix transcriptional regulator n=1 Tax=Oceanicoccus sp. KOV_DT_Chl TaxID=1904639 RepID=UPI000C7D8B15|nr:helix-turn-helix transcriptional regulator [Oceanicoccus sp. KOV_DT_Chl]
MLNSDLIHYDALISAIYQGPLEATPWQQFLPLLSQRLDAFAVSLVLRPPAIGDSGLILNYQRPAAGEQSKTELADPEDWQASAYKEQFFALDPFVNLPIGEVVTLAEMVAQDQLETSEYYIQYLQPAGVYHIIGADTREPEGLVACLRVCRGKQEQAFNSEHKQLIAMIMPHLKRAIQFHARINRIESERDLYAHAVDKLAVGTIILDEQGKILSTNPLAGQLLAEKDGLFQKQQQLHISNTLQATELHTTVTNILAQRDSAKPAMAEAMRVQRPSGKADLGLVIRPVPSSQWSEGQASPTVAIFISDPEQQSETSQQVITRLFGFTPAEAALALLLAKGRSLAEASEQQHVSQHTARAQLKSIFSKTGVSRQAELVRLLVKSVANLG